MSTPRRRLGFAAAAALVALVASVNFLGGLGEPPHSIWDESYYLTAIARYEAGVAQFASHPPLGIALLAAGDELLHPNRGLDTTRMGRDMQIAGDQIPRGYSFAGVRLAPGVFAVLGAVVFFALMFILCESLAGALALTSLYVFENAFIVQFRAAQLDAFQIAFVLAALLCFSVSARRGARSSPLVDLGFGIFFGLANMVKVNAAVLALLGALLIARRIAIGWRSAPRGRLLLAGARDGVIMLVGCFIAVAGVFTIHFALSGLPPNAASPAGAKDLRFITAPYAQYLHGERPLSPAVVWAGASDYTRFMFSDFKGEPRSDPNGSVPLEWPLARGAINYRWDSNGRQTAYVQLAGNPAGWLLGLVALLAAIALVAARCLELWPPARPQRTPSAEARSEQPPRPQPPGAARRALIYMLLAQYGVFMAVHAYLGTQRVMYLYHYFIGLLLTFCLLPLVAAEAADRWPALRARRSVALGAMSVLLWAGFAFYAPLTFHWPLTHSQCEWLNLLGHVVSCR
ncbi:MAG: phospholipid carrier-dependent glycosyltransferase [Steroidobacteraceae bacterium]